MLGRSNVKISKVVELSGVVVFCFTSVKGEGIYDAEMRSLSTTERSYLLEF